MGVDIATYRARIGAYIQPKKHRLDPVNMLKINCVSLSIRILLFFLLCAQCVERNPGPTEATGRGQPTGRGSNRGQSHRGGVNYQTPPSRTQGRGRASPPFTRSSQRDIGINRQPNLNAWISDTHNTQTDTEMRRTRQQSETDQSGPEHNDLTQEAENLDTTTLLLEIRGDVKQMNRKFDNLEKSVAVLQQENLLLKEQNKTLTDNVQSLADSLEEVKRLATVNEQKNERLEAQSRRSNLKFHGITETSNETWEQSEAKIRDYLTEMNIDDTSIQIDRAHRLPGNSAPRPIIVKFPLYKDKDKILKQFRENRKNEVQYINEYKNVRVVEDFPERVTKQRTLLYPLLQKSIEEDKTAFFKFDRLVVDGVIYTWDYDRQQPVKVTR